MRVLLGRVLFVVASSLSSFKIYPAITFWLVEFLLRNQLIGVSLYAVFCFPLVAFNILSLSLIFVNLIVSLCVPPWVYPAWDSLCFLDLVDYFLYYVWEVFSYYLFKYFLRSFLSLFFWTPKMRMLVCLMSSQGFLRLSSFLFFFFSVFCSVAVISTILFSRSFSCSSASF